MDISSFFAQVLGAPHPPNMSLYQFVQVILGITTKLAIPVLVVLLVYWGFRIVASLGGDKEIAESRHRFFQVIFITGIFLGLGTLAAVIYGTARLIGLPVLFPAP